MQIFYYTTLYSRLQQNWMPPPATKSQISGLEVSDTKDTAVIIRNACAEIKNSPDTHLDPTRVVHGARDVYIRNLGSPARGGHPPILLLPRVPESSRTRGGINSLAGSFFFEIFQIYFLKLFQIFQISTFFWNFQNIFFGIFPNIPNFKLRNLQI